MLRDISSLYSIAMGLTSFQAQRYFTLSMRRVLGLSPLAIERSREERLRWNGTAGCHHRSIYRACLSCRTRSNGYLCTCGGGKLDRANGNPCLTCVTSIIRNISNVVRRKLEARAKAGLCVGCVQEGKDGSRQRSRTHKTR